MKNKSAAHILTTFVMASIFSSGVTYKIVSDQEQDKGLLWIGRIKHIFLIFPDKLLSNFCLN